MNKGVHGIKPNLKQYLGSYLEGKSSITKYTVTAIVAPMFVYPDQIVSEK
jgi:hypothetical protein